MRFLYHTGKTKNISKFTKEIEFTGCPSINAVVNLIFLWILDPSSLFVYLQYSLTAFDKPSAPSPPPPSVDVIYE